MAHIPATSSMADSEALRRLRVLHLEDSELDHELTLAHLRRGGLLPDARRVETEADYIAALAEPWDVILSDFNLPGFSGLSALQILRAGDLLLPFIIVSGEIGEDVAVQAMRNGANDYLLKNNLARLVPAMLHAIDATEAQRAKRASEDALAESEERARELAQHLQASIEQERSAIAREIHDDVGGSLTALKFDLAWIERNARHPEIAQRALEALETVAHAIEASQRIMHNLRPAILDQGLIAAVHWMTQRFEKRSAVQAVFRCNVDELPTLPPGVPLVAYRMCQEALTNITKHAQASRVQVDLTIAGGVMSLEVSDNGRGLSGEDLAKARSFGIRGLRERAATVGGWIDLASGPGGTTLILSVPLDAEGSEHGDIDSVPGRTENADDPTTWGTI
ncbi:histidine kinase [Caldimonas sp. KR1-144]|uniref:hybrid sensor histidine kinase/response regulator n=1 Tax=Caldimonas sp. KR1-144 TaxID=3400911 RepID=UPI003C082838